MFHSVDTTYSQSTVRKQTVENTFAALSSWNLPFHIAFDDCQAEVQLLISQAAEEAQLFLKQKDVEINLQ